MRTVKSIIDDLGGISAVAKAHKPPLATSTVSSWTEVNYVPGWRQAELIAIAEKKGIPLQISDFPAKDMRLKAVS